MCHEASLHDSNCFLTLTYSPQQLPADLSLDPRHFQLFMKRLRKAVNRPVRYFHCGEYGDENLRPHYHAVLFGIDFGEDRVLWRVKGRNRVYTSKFLENVWGKGFCTIGDVSFKSAAYVARYVMKKATGELRESRYKRVDGETGEEFDVRPEYATMSRRPGIGREWFSKFSGDVFPDDEVVFEGRRFRPPRYYSDLLEASDIDAFERVKARRAENVSARSKDLTASRLHARETIAASKLRAFKREV